MDKYMVVSLWRPGGKDKILGTVNDEGELKEFMLNYQKNNLFEERLEFKAEWVYTLSDEELESLNLKERRRADERTFIGKWYE